MNRPEWAKAKVKLHLATCWMGIDDEIADMPLLCGVNWFQDHILLPISVFIHNFLVAPFRDEGFPIRIIEEYDGFEEILEDADDLD